MEKLNSHKSKIHIVFAQINCILPFNPEELEKEIKSIFSPFSDKMECYFVKIPFFVPHPIYVPKWFCPDEEKFECAGSSYCIKMLDAIATYLKKAFSEHYNTSQKELYIILISPVNDAYASMPPKNKKEEYIHVPVSENIFFMSRIIAHELYHAITGLRDDSHCKNETCIFHEEITRKTKKFCQTCIQQLKNKLNKL